jgi:hypothetical protein
MFIYYSKSFIMFQYVPQTNFPLWKENCYPMTTLWMLWVSILTGYLIPFRVTGEISRPEL